MIGTKILHYNIIEKLGEGGMGEVYLAEDEKLHRRVALKFLHGDFEHDPEARDRLFREARAASKLSHANIVAIHAIEEAGDRVFIAMEHVEGQSLRALIKRGEVDTDRALEIAPQILAALAGAHETGIVHRDIKSDNIVITKNGRVKVLDFGLAKAKGAATITRPGSSGGTPAYMSPEQVQGGAVDHRSDLFSFGVVLYEMLTGRLPFKGEHESAVTYSIVNETPEAMSKYRDLPDGLQAIVDRALEKDPEKRYQGAVEIEADIARVRAGTAGPRGRGAGRRTRKPFLVALTVVVVAAAAAFFVGRGGGGDSTGTAITVAEAPEAARRMLVVLPFENLGPTDQEYFADGVTEEITTRLAKLSGLGVISRTSAEHYKGSDKSLRQISDELGVEYALEGSIRWDRSGDADRVRVSAQLIRTADDTHLWAETYDRVFDQIFDLQSEIAEEVAKAMDVTLLEPEVAALKERPTENLDAYDLFLKAREHWDRGGTMEDRDQATRFLEQAISIDSTFASAQAMLARIYANDYFNNRQPEKDRLKEALKAAQAALRVAPHQPQGHIAMGYYYYYGDRDYEKALQEFDVASRAQPNNAEMLEAMGYVLRRQGRFDEAVEKLRRSAELDPTSVEKSAALVETLIRMRRYQEADRLIARATKTTNDPMQFQVLSALSLLLQGDVTSARRIVADIRSRYHFPQVRSMQTQLEICDRDFVEALETHGQLGSWAPRDTLEYYSTKALIYHVMGEQEKARAYYDSTRTVGYAKLKAGEVTYLALDEIAQAEAALGHHEAAVDIIAEAEDMMPMSRDAIAGADVILARAITYMILGDEDKAIDDLEYLLSIPSNVSPALLRIHPGFDELRDNARFQKLATGKSSS